MEVIAITGNLPNQRWGQEDGYVKPAQDVFPPLWAMRREPEGEQRHREEISNGGVKQNTDEQQQDMRHKPTPPALLHRGEERQRPQPQQRRDEVLLPQEAAVPHRSRTDGEDERAPGGDAPSEATQGRHIADG